MPVNRKGAYAYEDRVAMAHSMVGGASGLQAAADHTARPLPGLHADRRHRRRGILALAYQPPEALREGEVQAGVVKKELMIKRLLCQYVLQEHCMCRVHLVTVVLIILVYAANVHAQPALTEMSNGAVVG